VSLTRFKADMFEYVTLVTHPKQIFLSSSAGLSPPSGSVTGSMPLVISPSPSIKMIGALSSSISAFVEDIPGSEYPMRRASRIINKEKIQGLPTSNVENLVSGYMKAVNNAREDPKNKKKFEITRLEPTKKFTETTTIKGFIKDILMDSYRVDYSNCSLSYINYNCLNFFTSSKVPDNSVILYPNFSASYSNNQMPYTPKGEFTVDFWINPRYTNDYDMVSGVPTGKEFKAGTILHLSSTFAVSLVTGSSTNSINQSDKFRIMLQLSHSADIAPSKIDLNLANNERSSPQDLIFLSKDGSLRRNHWHHVTVRWGTQRINLGSGSIQIDKNEFGFVVPSASIAPPLATDMLSNDPDVMCMGNFYEGRNQGADSLDMFFNSNAATREGLPSAPGRSVDPSSYTFAHPLNAEIHDVKIYNKFLDDDQVYSASITGPKSIKNLAFYVPPFFMKAFENREMLVSPSHTTTTSSAQPFNLFLAYGPGGHLINLENFTTEIIRQKPARLFNLTASTSPSFPASASMNEILYATGSIRKRNLTVLPCDNGLFVPNFNLLVSGTKPYNSSDSPMSHFINAAGGFDPSLISLETLVTRDFFLKTLAEAKFLEGCSGPYPENLGKEWNGKYLAIFQRLKDGSSNQISMFNIPSLFYSQEIFPGSLSVIDKNLSGSGEKVSISLRDDGYGGLFRGDCLTTQAGWNTVGNIFYNEGFAIIKSPHLNFFGKDQFKMTFKGEHDVHILTLNAFCNAAEVNSSSNPSYLPVFATLNSNDTDPKFVYIDQINIHDDNLNIIMKANLAQPMLKRSCEKFLFKLKMDF